VKQQVEHKKTVFEMISDNANGHMAGGVDAIMGHRGTYWVFHLPLNKIQFFFFLMRMNSNFFQNKIINIRKSFALKNIKILKNIR
jgi:hypothetical protein